MAESRVETPRPILSEGLLAEIRKVSRAIAAMTVMGRTFFRIVERARDNMIPLADMDTFF